MADKLDLVFKKVVNRQYTTTAKQWYEENPGVPFKLKGSDVWIDNIPTTPPAVDTAVVKGYRTTNKLVLTKDTSVNLSKSWYAKEGADRLDGFIAPRFGQGYTARLFIAGGAEVPTTDICGWFFDYESGNLTFDGTAPNGGAGFEIVAYKYIGATADDLAAALEGSAWQDPVSSIVNTPTGSETGLVRYLVSATPSGVFAGHANEIAEFDGVNWNFTEASAGKITYVIALDRLYVYDNNLGWAWSGIDSADLDYDNADSDLDALSVKDALDELDRLSKSTTTILWVDTNRIDSYVSTGSTAKPFKTLAAAVSLASPGNTIQMYPGTYDGAGLTVDDGVSVIGTSLANTIVNNDIIFGSDSTSLISLENVSFGNGTVVINNTSDVKNIKSNGNLTINGNCSGFNVDVNGTLEKESLIIAGNVVNLDVLTLNNTADKLSLKHTAGKLSLSTVRIKGNRSGFIVESTGAKFEASFASIMNEGTGKSLNIANSAQISEPNRLHDVTLRGDIDTGDCPTIVEGVSGGVLNSTVAHKANLLYRGGTQLKNESTIIKDVAGGTLVGKTINDSLDRLANTMQYDSTHRLLILQPCIDNV